MADYESIGGYYGGVEDPMRSGWANDMPVTLPDVINHPPHYIAGRKYEPIDVIHDWGLPFNAANALKYIARLGRKGDPVEDARKAIFYLQDYIKRQGATP